MHLLYPEMTSTWSDVFGLLILSFNGIGMMYVFGTYITASGELRRLNILYSSFVFLNVLANYLLIPRYGAWGAAVATFGTQSLVAIALFVMARQSAKWDLTPHHILRPLAFLVGVVALAFGASHLSLELSWIWRFALTALCTFAFAFIIGMVDRNEFLALAGSRRTPN